MPKRKLDLNPNQKNDTSILRTLKKLTTAVPNTEQQVYSEVSEQLIDNQDNNINLTPVLTQVARQVSTPVDIPLLEPALNPTLTEVQPLVAKTQDVSETEKPSKRNTKTNKDQPIGLTDMARWHSETEQKVYKAMYQEAKIHNTKELYFTFLSLAEKTGFRNPRTIRAAIHGLIAKKSIDEIVNKHGEHLGIRYRIFSPEEIIQNRTQANINIDFQSKKII